MEHRQERNQYQIFETHSVAFSVFSVRSVVYPQYCSFKWHRHLADVDFSIHGQDAHATFFAK